MDDRKRALELFAKQLSEGLPFAEDFIKVDADIENNALLARNLSEEALANEVLKNTGIPIPGKEASKSKMDDFYHRIMQERYPELKPQIVTGDIIDQGAYGWYNPVMDTIVLDENTHKTKGLPRAVGTLLHEAGHQYDDKMKVVNPGENIQHISKELDLGTLRNAKNAGTDLKKMDPVQVYELYSKGHHAQIPSLREGSYGLGALKSMMKSGTFKGVAPVLAKAGLATAGGLVSLASEAADSEDMGGGAEQAALLRETDERKRRENALNSVNPEQKQALNYMYSELDNGQTFNARRDALRKLTGK